MICPEFSTNFAHDRGRERLMDSFEGLSLTDLPDGHPPSHPLLFFGGQREERGTTVAFDRPMFSWSLGGDDDGFESHLRLDSAGRCFEEEFAAGLTLEELADSHLKNHGLGRKEADCRDDLRHHVNGKELEVGDKHSSCATANELPFVTGPSLLGHVLCRKQQVGKSAACTVLQRTYTCPQEIKPFDFKSPSPDDLVRASQKGQKHGIRKQLLTV